MASLGDIALVGYSADTGAGPGGVPKSFAFVLLADLSGETISFTDNGWLAAGGFRSGEGTVSFTVAPGTPIGTVITISGLTGTLNPSTAGDQILAYQGPATSPTFLFALDFGDNNATYAGDATSSNTSAVPTGLVFGQTALAFAPDNGAYTGSLSGTRAQILANIANSANWTTDDAAAVAYPTAFSVNVGGTAAVSIADASITETEGAQILTLTVTRSATDTAFTVDFATGAGTATAGSDYTAASGTLSFAENGPATQTISIEILGDATPEPTETFNVVLSNIVASVGTVTFADASADVTVFDNDSAAVSVWINEFHYDNAGTDVGEFVEIAGNAGVNLAGYSLVLYNGNGGAPYQTIALSGLIPDQQNGFGVLSFAAPGLQNGNPDGIALVGPDNSVVEFISYDGSFTAVGGPANGMLGADVGPSEPGNANGTSIARVGLGGAGADFTWVLDTDDTPGFVNNNQFFLDPATTRVAISDASVIEGDAGASILAFTVSRSDATSAFTVDFATADGTALAGSDYVAQAGTLSFEVGGALAQTINVIVNGDADVEPNELLSVVLSNLVVASGAAFVVDYTGQGTIINDDVAITAIYDIQGPGHTSPFVGQTVTTRGIVTALAANGFWIQDATGDGNNNTSDGIFVFTSTAPPGAAAIGNLVQVSGNVSEFRSSGRVDDLTLTELTVPTVSVLSTGNVLPAAIVIGGAGGRTPPTVSMGDDETTGVFDIVNDGIDFWESLEGMRVTLADARITDPNRSNFGEIYVTPDVADAASTNAHGGLTIGDPDPASIADSPNQIFDFNPQLIQLDDNAGIATPTAFGVGDSLGDVTGVVNYGFGRYEINATEAYTLTSAGLEKEITDIEVNLDRVRIATFNVENLAPSDPATKFAALAAQIVNALGSPEIIALQEVQDNSGTVDNGITAADQTLQLLIAAIELAGGPHYLAIDAPPENNQDGGAPGGNIRPAYLYDPRFVQPTENNGLSGAPGDLVRVFPTTDRIGADPDLVTGPLPRDPNFAATRGSVPIEWSPVGYTPGQGGSFWTINNHFSSKGGSAPLANDELGTPLYSAPANSAAVKREGQAIAVNAFVDALLGDAVTSDNKVVAVGDFNEFQFFPAAQLVAGALERLTVGTGTTASTFANGAAIMTALSELLPEAERYSYVFEGRAQELDQTLATNNLIADALFDIVHLNAEFQDQSSDHDPSVLSLLFARSFAIATEGDDVLDAAAYAAAFGALRGSLDGDDTIYALGGNDRVEAGAGDDRVFGDAGDDALFGGAGDDVITGGAGADLFVGGAGNDRHDGGAANDGVDTFQFTLGDGFDSIFNIDVDIDVLDFFGAGLVRTAFNVASVGEDQLLSFTTANAPSVLLSGVSFADVASMLDAGRILFENSAPVAQDDRLLITRAITSNLSLDVLLANDSDADHDALSITGVSNVSNAIVDIVNGALRIFTLAQHAGFDYTISDGQGGTDTGHVAIDTIDFLLPIRGMVDAGAYDAADLSGGRGIDTLRGSPGDDRLNGGVGADTLEGRGGDDVINGGRGADVITGGLGADILTGGLGADRFVYTALADFAAGEAITDFARGDRIDLRAIDANAGVGGNQAFAFIGLGAFTGVAGQLHYALTTGGAVLSGDVDGDAVADFSLFLAGVSTLREGDFIL